MAGEKLGRKTDSVPVLPSKRSLRPARPEGLPTGRMATLRSSLWVAAVTCDKGMPWLIIRLLSSTMVADGVVWL